MNGRVRYLDGTEQVQLTCPNCRALENDCERCQTANACDCCPCECCYVDPSPAAKEAMRRYDAEQERKEAKCDP